MATESKRCTGHCCRCFWLPYPPAVLKKRAKTIEDGKKILDMVIYLGRFNRHPLFKKGEGPAGRLSYYYSCRHLQLNGDCGNYKNRPRMCVEYPYNSPCDYTSCTRRVTT